MTKTNQELSKTRRDDMDALALALGFRSKHDPNRGSHRAMETAMLVAWRNQKLIVVDFVSDGNKERMMACSAPVPAAAEAEE